MKNIKLNELLLIIAGTILLLNLAAMLIFTFTVNGKLNDAIALASPQEGTITLINADDCEKCRDLEIVKKDLIAQNIEFSEEITLQASDEEAQKLIERYEIKRLPALIFNSNKKLKAPLRQALKEKEIPATNNGFVWEQQYPPYFDLESTTTTGLVNVIFLTDNTCADCYDVVQTQKPILSSFGIAINSEKIVDLSEPEGRNLKNKYNITEVPTVILSPEAADYPALSKVWPQAGTIEGDGFYIFRNMEILKVKYRAL